MEGKKTRGKQKREIKKIVNERDLFITFTKRKSGINKKASELTTLCGAKVDILMFSPSGKPFCFGEPSLQSMTRTRLNEENPAGGGIYDKLMEDYKRLEIHQLNEKYDSLLDQVHAEKAREKELGGILKTRDSCGWWEAKVQDLIRDDQAKGMEAYFVELQKDLMNELSINGGETASHALAPIDQTSGVNSYPTNARGSNISEVVFGANNEAHGTGATENITLPNFSSTPTNEVEAFNLIPHDGRRGDLFDVVFPPNNDQARGASLFYLDDPNGSGKSAIASLPANETQELHLTDASGSGSHATAM